MIAADVHRTDMHSPQMKHANLFDLMPRATTGLLVLAVGLEIVFIARSNLQGVAPVVVDPVPAASAALVRTPPVDPAVLAAAALFGVSDAPAAAETAVVQSSLVLVGTFSSSDPQRGSAIIGPQADRAAVFQVGALVDGVARLEEVHLRHVLLNRNGQRERVDLVQAVPNLLAGAVVPPPKADGATAALLVAEPAVAPPIRLMTADTPRPKRPPRLVKP
jgi:type II secretory pathway component PulC